MKNNTKTLTHRVAAIQVKMLHLQFRMKLIHENQGRIIEKSNAYRTDREKVKGMYSAAYNVVDMLTTFENIYQLMDDIFATSELKDKMESELRKILGTTKSISLKWKKVRNKLGGHIDIEMVEKFCKQNSYLGVFISDDLEADTGILNMLMIAGACNAVRDKYDIFGRDLDLKKNGPGPEMEALMTKIDEDWGTAFAYFEPMMKFLYKVGKEEKLSISTPESIKGIMTD